MKRKTGKIIALLLSAVMMTGTVTVYADELGPEDVLVYESAETLLADDADTSFELDTDSENITPDTDNDVATYEDFSESSPAEENENGVVVNSYNIKFDRNGGECGKMGAMKDCKVGKSYKLVSNKFARAGYKFNGWNTRKNGKGKSFKNKASVKNLTTKNKGTVTLYAQWKKDKKANFTVRDTDTGQGVVVFVKNNTSNNYKVVVCVTYYQGDVLITSYQDTAACIQSKTTAALKCNLAYSYDSYKVKVQYKEKYSKKTKCYVKKARKSVKNEKNKKRFKVTLSNLDKNIKNATVAVVFYKNNKAVGYAKEKESLLFGFKGKKSWTHYFKYPVVNGKTILADKCVVYLNDAYYYSF